MAIDFWFFFLVPIRVNNRNWYANDLTTVKSWNAAKFLFPFDIALCYSNPIGDRCGVSKGPVERKIIS